MNVKTLSLGELQSNTYLVTDSVTGETIIIDPADDANFITEEILRSKLTPTAIIATHGHFDHLLAAWELQMAFNLPFFVHPKDVFLVNTMANSAKKWLGKPIFEKSPEYPINILTLTTETNLQVIETPGHTPGSVCLVLPSDKAIFTGDTLFAQHQIGRNDFSYSSATNLLKSVKKIREKYRGFLAYPGHGENFVV